VQKKVVKRDGQKDLKFTGEPLAEASNQWIAGKDQTRWTEIRIYRTDKGKYVVSVIGVTRWQGEQDSHKAEVCETAEEVYKELLTEDFEGAFLPDVAKEALEEAAKNDPAFESVRFEEI